MPLYNTKAHFLYRQFFLTPSTILTLWEIRPSHRLKHGTRLRSRIATPLPRSIPTHTHINSDTAAWVRFNEATIATAQNTSLLSALNDEKNFVGTNRYYTSKLLQQPFLRELVSRRSKEGKEKGPILNLGNPGFCYGSDLHRGAPGVAGKIPGGVKRVVGRSVAVGARALVHVAVCAGVESDGMYLSDCAVAPFAGFGNTKGGRRVQKLVCGEIMGKSGGVIDIERLAVR
ncbi:hypothetical protein BDV19DRAFT_393365 [Aspergillus venezuelensis]